MSVATGKAAGRARKESFVKQDANTGLATLIALAHRRKPGMPAGCCP